MQRKEKRRRERTVFKQAVEFEISATRQAADSQTCKAMGLDINSRGIGLETAEELFTGDLVKMYVPLGSAGAFIPVFAEVRWVNDLDGKYRAGLHFLS